MKHIKMFEDHKKTITLFEREMVIKKEYALAMCIWETTGSDLEDYENVKIEFGQKVYNVKILDSGSIIFTMSPESSNYVVTMSPEMFGIVTDEQIAEIKKLEDIIKKANDSINNIYKNIERTVHINDVE